GYVPEIQARTLDMTVKLGRTKGARVADACQQPASSVQNNASMVLFSQAADAPLICRRSRGPGANLLHDLV
ncbi:hypothetical protein KI387_011545, partial [Taxus chinensis]